MIGNRYVYPELREAALSNPSLENCERLADWLDSYDLGSWNGERWNLGDGYEMIPIWKQEGDDDFIIVGYEIR